MVFGTMVVFFVGFAKDSVVTAFTEDIRALPSSLSLFFVVHSDAGSSHNILLNGVGVCANRFRCIVT